MKRKQRTEILINGSPDYAIPTYRMKEAPKNFSGGCINGTDAKALLNNPAILLG